MTDKKYFKKLLFSIGGLFVITCFSIIFCIINSNVVEEAQTTSHVMSVVYLVFQLLMEAIVFYYAFKAMVNGSSLIKAVMYVKDGVINQKSKRNALIIYVISSMISIFFLITLMPINFLSFFSLGLRFALLNCALLIAVVSLFFLCYRRNSEVE